MMLKVFLAFSLLVSLSSAQSMPQDFCVADRRLPKGPAGWPCMNASMLTVDDFVFSQLGVPGNTSNPIGVAATAAVDATFPALNGMGIAMSRLDLAVGGVVPVHTHRVSEVLILIEGSIIAGFIGSDDTPYFKTLKKGDIMIFPPSLLHFQVNVGKTPALAFVSLNSAFPGFQLTSTSLFGNNLPTEIVEKISFVDKAEIKRLKAMFGGTN